MQQKNQDVLFFTLSKYVGLWINTYQTPPNHSTSLVDLYLVFQAHGFSPRKKVVFVVETFYIRFDSFVVPDNFVRRHFEFEAL